MKNEIRKRILKLRESYQVNKEDIYKIKEKFLSLLDKYKSERILLYYPHKNEINTIPIIEELLKRKKTVLLPKVEKGKILPILISDISNLKVGFAGIKEPEGEVFPKNSIDITVVPAVAYDRRGYRLGYGKGFYDRFLQDFKNLKVGLAYKFQVLDKIPFEKHDIPVDIIITHEEVIEAGRERSFLNK
ncbi:MAG: 5-formyltetrahydrofolate cyclo-ligase [Persephonella sp.]|nr:MAG: 5-formyltetrahydrofolate cyclo-ligase [Persephonella sp.]RUM62446.1 MAG: 5-formyltetrahydrofolate cyclo-ligase [Persephonella sp.]